MLPGTKLYARHSRAPEAPEGNGARQSRSRLSAVCASYDEIGVGSIPLSDHLGCVGPDDSEGRVIPAHPAPELRGVELRYLVEHLTMIFEAQEAVGKTCGDVEHPAVGCRQLDGEPLPQRRRFWAQVNDHIIDRS